MALSKPSTNRLSLMRKDGRNKGISSIISTLIITAALLIILVVASFVATNILSLQIADSEFEQAQSNMLLLDSVIQDVSLRPGAGGYVQFNQRTGGIGVAEQTDNIMVLAYPSQTAVTLKPNGFGAYSGWSVSTRWWNGNSVERYNLTSDEEPDTYLYTTTSEVESQNLQDPLPNLSGLTIGSVAFHVKARRGAGNGDCYIKIRLRTHDIDYENATAWKLSNSYKDFEVSYSKNPYTNSAWTWNEINDLQIGCCASTVASGARVDASEFYIVIDFPPSTPAIILDGSYGTTNFVYRASTGTSAAETVLRGTSDIKVDLVQGLGFLRVEQDDGAKIKLDYTRIRINSETILDSNTALIQVTLLNLTRGNMGGAETVTLKVQNTRTTSTPYILNSPVVTIKVQWNGSTGSYVFDASALGTSVTKTVVMFTKITIQASTA